MVFFFINGVNTFSLYTSCEHCLLYMPEVGCTFYFQASNKWRGCPALVWPQMLVVRIYFFIFLPSAAETGL